MANHTQEILGQKIVASNPEHAESTAQIARKVNQILGDIRTRKPQGNPLQWASLALMELGSELIRREGEEKKYRAQLEQKLNHLMAELKRLREPGSKS